MDYVLDYKNIEILNPITNQWITLEEFRKKEETTPDWVNAVMGLVQHNESR